MKYIMVRLPYGGEPIRMEVKDGQSPEDVIKTLDMKSHVMGSSSNEGVKESAPMTGTSPSLGLEKSFGNVGKHAYAGLVGAGRAVPGSDLMGAAIRGAARDVKGWATSPLEQIQSILSGENTNQFWKDYETIGSGAGHLREEMPVSTLAGQIPTQIALFKGMSKLPGMNLPDKIIPTPGVGNLARTGLFVARNAAKAGRGAVSNVALQQFVEPTMDSGKIETDAMYGAAGELAGAGLGAVARGSSRLGKRVMSSAFKTPKADLKRGKDLAQEAYDRKIWGTRTHMMDQAEKGIMETEAKLQGLLDAAEGTKFYRTTFADELNVLKNKYLQLPGREHQVEAIEAYMKDAWKNKTSGMMTPSEANQLKRLLYQMRETAYSSSGNPAFASQMDMTMATGLRKGIEQAVPGARELNRDLSFYGRLADALEAAEMAKSGQQIIPTREGILGLLAGSQMGIPTGIGTTAAVSATRSPLLLTGAARGLRGISDIIQQPLGFTGVTRPSMSLPELLKLYGPLQSAME